MTDKVYVLTEKKLNTILGHRKFKHPKCQQCGDDLRIGDKVRARKRHHGTAYYHETKCGRPVV